MTAVRNPIALTMGEPAGIGGEITMKAWMRRAETGLPPFFVIDDPERLERLRNQLEWPVTVATIDSPEETSDTFATALPVLARALPGSVVPGQPDPENSAQVVRSIEEAANLVLDGSASAIVTNPIHKHLLYEIGFEHPGHTEYFAKLVGDGVRPVMMLTCPGLRAVPVTIHQSLAEAIASLKQEDIVKVARTMFDALRQDFAIDRPHLAVAALNPHAGEEGSMGREEAEIIKPAVEELKRTGISVSGPAPADSMFHERARQTYDAAICMYHDQALIPVKTIDFHEGVNVTLGLPFVRTSPDHGTAFEIAGTGVANETSLIASLKLARWMVECRAARETRGHQAVV
ncbi:MAG: 4-hydroxythreonine-4-phosphate dehydrogenase PdxA [Alphaproteobacteria bacterium]|jgi:4-hydroxythreonine-4-phosphate dehydrogenase|nr:4-hydroxythreonine-4-phosphate dehydrogenase PdxA [Alphaproteobacteria bacterium]